MAITMTTPDGTVITTITDLQNWYYQKRESRASNPANGELVVFADRKPGTATS